VLTIFRFEQGENDGVLDAHKAEIYDLLAATRWALRYGTDAAISVLRVDSIMYVSSHPFLCSLTDPSPSQQHEPSFGRTGTAQAGWRLGPGLSESSSRLVVGKGEKEEGTEERERSRV
jgi:hypothetical protein